MITAIEVLATAEEWAGAIGRARNKAVDSILEMGGLLIQAKAALEHGEFSRMFADSEARVGRPPVAEPLPFNSASAYKLMAIASNQLLSNASLGKHLPSSWTILYELTTLPADVLEAKLETGEINPTIQRKDIKRWKPQPQKDEWDESMVTASEEAACGKFGDEPGLKRLPKTNPIETLTRTHDALRSVLRSLQLTDFDGVSFDEESIEILDRIKLTTNQIRTIAMRLQGGRNG